MKLLKDIIPELEKIAAELRMEIKNYAVIKEYLRRNK